MKSVIIDCQSSKDHQQQAHRQKEKKCSFLEDSTEQEEVTAFDIRDKNETSARPVVSYAFRDGAITTAATSAEFSADSDSNTAPAGVTKGP